MKNLKEIRKIFGISLSNLAKQFEEHGYKITRQALSQMENGVINVTEERLNQLSEVFEIPKSYLLMDELSEKDNEEIKKFKIKAEAQDLLGGEIKIKNKKLYSFIKIENWSEDLKNIEHDGEWREVTNDLQIRHLIKMKTRVINTVVNTNWLHYRNELKQYLDELLIIEEYLLSKQSKLEDYINKKTIYDLVLEKFNITEEEFNILEDSRQEWTDQLQNKIENMNKEEQEELFEIVFSS
ncbi:helix-turn-helix domain-containing protein [Anaerophilus nitritogenes]|uniref:helix-turn-helix domain-containing protein n=1 Tax=Anaerophilus nitritogenes TaxID=2498136 RepID=UPI0013EDC501|nr:helix-turn-helix transcriptional regulator [Anaerophilus nitritogenes]